MSHILVVDDEVGIRELLRELLEDAGYRVTTASSAAEAERQWAAARPDLVLLDLSLPDRDGLTLIKSWSVNNELPVAVVILSAYGSVDSAVEATRLGAYDFLEKPVSLDRLLRTVRRALSVSEREENQAPSRRPAAPARADTDPPGWAFEALGLPYREARTEFERAYFLHAFASEGGNMSQVAERTGIERTHLYRKFKWLGIRPRLATQ